MNSFIERVVNYCRKMSGQDMPIKLMDSHKLGRFPLTITGTYTCYEAIMMNIPITLLELHSNEYTPMQLEKHQQIVTKLIGNCAVFAMETVASYNLSRMVNARINFIIPGKQIYIPSFLINLRKVSNNRRLEDELIPGIAQCLLLSHIQRDCLNGCTIERLAERFNTTYSSMSRALRWLKMKDLVDMYGVKEKKMMIEGDGKYLWKKSAPLLLSPVERVLYTDKKPEGMPYGGETALEKLSMIVTREKSCWAVSKKWAKEHKDLLDKHYGDYKVEVWRYDPILLAENEIVDPLSLYLSFKNNEDERIQIEIKNLIGKTL